MVKKSGGYSIGVDYGTNSVRALVLDLDTGKETASHVYAYPSGRDGILLESKDPNLARQNPMDYLKGFNASVGGAVAKASRKRGFDPSLVRGIGIDATGSTPIPVDRDGAPLSASPRFKKRMAARAWLWKDHTAHEEAALITEKATRLGAPYLDKCGGTYSSEWFWSKVWHCARTSPEVFDAAYSWVECCDFVPAHVTGNADPLVMKRSVCAAGHKGMYNEEWGGLPSRKFLKSLSPELGELRERLYEKAVPSDRVAGFLSPAYAEKVGLPAGVPVAVGAIDAHMGAVGAGIKPGSLVKIIGTSTCDMMVSPLDQELADIPGVCGIAPGSILPDMHGIEAGQSAVGDIFNWFVTNFCCPGAGKGDPHARLTREAARLRPGESGLLALDWNNGNRTVLVDPLLSGLLVGQTLHTTAAEAYRALIEATAFGALTIVRRLEEHGVEVREVINCGGIAEKNDFLMRVYADILNRPMKISDNAQTCALGAAIFGAVAGSAFKTTRAAQRRLAASKSRFHKPDKRNAKVYAELYRLYMTLHDGFGLPGSKDDLSFVMKELIGVRDRERAAGSRGAVEV